MYKAEFNYYVAMLPKGERSLAKFNTWLEWRNTQAIRLMNNLDLC